MEAMGLAEKLARFALGIIRRKNALLRHQPAEGFANRTRETVRNGFVGHVGGQSSWAALSPRPCCIGREGAKRRRKTLWFGQIIGRRALVAGEWAIFADSTGRWPQNRHRHD